MNLLKAVSWAAVVLAVSPVLASNYGNANLAQVLLARLVQTGLPYLRWAFALTLTWCVLYILLSTTTHKVKKIGMVVAAFVIFYFLCWSFLSTLIHIDDTTENIASIQSDATYLEVFKLPTKLTTPTT